MNVNNRKRAMHPVHKAFEDRMKRDAPEKYARLMRARQIAEVLPAIIEMQHLQKQLVSARKHLQSSVSDI